nr:hypothetical protein BaRGS_002925 [Batillaria attramentaria]KAG5704767.1 hypothetical protein BaRGS_005223 [Batillaria attramentaria]
MKCRDDLTLEDARLLKRSLQDALQQHFELLQEAEEDIMERIEALKAKRQAISQRKRSHYMCLVNLIACYRK